MTITIVFQPLQLECKMFPRNEENADGVAEVWFSVVGLERMFASWVKQLFREADKDSNGELNVKETTRILNFMNLNMDETETAKVSPLQCI